MRIATSRQADPEEVRILRDVLTQARRDFAASPASAAAFVAIGGSPIPKDIATIELAAWMQVSRAILNLHETFNRE
ncbi:MAG: hypothetical protein QMB94_13915 [Phycisphaerales bacterium]